MVRNKILIKILAIIALCAFIGVSVLTVIPINSNAASVTDAQRKQKEAKQKENDAKQLQNVLFYATYRSHQRQTRPTDDSSHAYPLLRSLHRTSFPNDYLQ